MPIKVTHIVRQYAPSIGGMENVVQNIARLQREQHGQLPRIVTLNRLFRNSAELLEPEALINGVGVVRLPYHGTSRYPFCPQVLGHLEDADVIHVHGIDFFFDYLAATKKLHKRPLVASTHGGFFHTKFASGLKRLYFNTITRASCMAYDKIIATSDNDGDIFRDIVKSPKLSVIENGVDVEKYRDHSSVESTRTLIYFGRWSANKGLLEMLDLFKQLATRESGWKLIIAGREYDLGAEQLRDLVVQQHLTAAVQIVANPSDHELAALIRQSSYFICLSRHEGFGIAPIEAMSAGLIPILSDIPPFRHLLEHAPAGLVLTQENVAAKVAQIARLHEETSSDYARRRAQVQSFVERYSWRRIATKYVDVYQTLLN
ncbi:glycosyltransferase family 4 protein [Herbaspirillum lusitanum]|uniref:glycosyltransferase family 4 protein n=1 Tax=Herbaspirillum lusitanum TaxID=213312 RepID=UPI0002DCFEFC|nr:glycosyltransferase family 4 protein [Herbaspirillum lusitanum]MCW5299751.1 glycosyltransferase family 1 protein [Herbaspirillum lusitanum]